MPLQFEKNVINFLPITAARGMYGSFPRIKYAFEATFYNQIRAALPLPVRNMGARDVCKAYHDDEFGLEMLWVQRERGRA